MGANFRQAPVSSKVQATQTSARGPNEKGRVDRVGKATERNDVPERPKYEIYGKGYHNILKQYAKRLTTNKRLQLSTNRILYEINRDTLAIIRVWQI